AEEDLAHVPACRKVDVRSGAGPTVGFVTGNFGRLPLRCVGRDGLEEALDEPAVVWRKEEVLHIGRWLNPNLLRDVAANHRRNLREKGLQRDLTVTAAEKVASEGAAELEDEFLDATLRAELGERDFVEASWAGERKAAFVVDV